MSFLRKLPIAVALAVAPALSSAFSYDYLEASYGEFDVVKGASDDGDALYLGGAMSLSEQWGLMGSLGVLDYGFNLDGNSLSFGGQFHTAVKSAKNLDFVGSAELLYYTWDLPAGAVGDDDTTGIRVAGGLRYEVQDNFQVGGKLAYTSIDNIGFDDGVGISIDGRYYLNEQASLALGLANDTEFDGLWFNFRYDLK